MLSEFGTMKGKCKSISLKDGDYVSSLNLDFDEKLVKRIIFLTSKGQMFTAGKVTGEPSE